MKCVTALILSLLIAALNVSQNVAFSGGFMGTKMIYVQNRANINMEYIPSGMSPEQWKKMKEKERNKNKGKNLGKSGITTFQSQSFADWQKRGQKNLFPVDPKKVKDPSQIPYM